MQRKIACYFHSQLATCGNYATLPDVTDGFPEDFSIITTVRPEKHTRGYLFTMYSGLTTREIFGLGFGEETTFLYEDQSGYPGLAESPTFDVDLTDGE